jgi:hypothetical protein
MNICKPSFHILTILFFLLAIPLLAQIDSTAQDSLRLLAPRTSLPDSLRVDDQSVKLFLDKIEVEGKLEKPQAIFIIPGSDPEIDDIQIQRSFFEEIFRPVEPVGRVGLRQKPALTSKRKDVLPW